MGIFDGILGAGLNLIGGIMANDAAQERASEQMQFQEYMSSSAHQREVEDLRKAGLNPMLSLRHGGASSPPGAMAPVQNIAAGVSSALGSALIRAQLDKLEAETKEVEAREENVRSNTVLNTIIGPKLEQDTRTAAASAVEIDERTRRHAADTKRALADADRIAQQERLNEHQTRLVKQEILNAIETGANLKLQGISEKARGQLLQLEIPRSINLAEAEKTWWKKEVSPFLLDVMRLFNSGGSFGRAIR